MNFEKFCQQELNTTQGLRAILDTTLVEDIERLVEDYAGNYAYEKYVNIEFTGNGDY